MKTPAARRKLQKAAAGFAVEGIEGVAGIARVTTSTAATAVVKAVIAYMKEADSSWTWEQAAVPRRRNQQRV